MRKSEKTTTRGAADLQAQLSEAWSKQFSHSGETYGRLFAAMREEFTDFVQRRLDANMTAYREWTECRSVNDAMALQQRWVQSTVEQYIDQGNRVFETCRLAATDIAETVQTTAEAAKVATKAATHEPEIKRAA